MINKQFRKQIAVMLTLLLLLGLIWNTESAGAAAKIRLSQTKVTLTEGKSKTITVKNRKKGQSLKWSSSKKSVAVVSEKGRITAKAPGQAVIKVKVGKSGRTLSCKVIVKAKQAEPSVDNHRKINITVGNETFAAELYDNRAVRELIERLPMTITMEELNGNEKYYYMESNLPQSAESVGTIHTGDLMLFGSDCLVLFYEDFRTSYSYTRLGKIKDSSDLAQALGSGSVKITFAKMKNNP